MEWEIDVAIPTSELERERAYCVLCDEQIKNPLCPNCIAKGFKQWIQKFPNHTERTLRKRTDAFLRSYKNIGYQEIECVSCGHKHNLVCPDCFVDYLYQICIEEGLSVSNLREFLLIFDFNFQSKTQKPHTKLKTH